MCRPHAIEVHEKLSARITSYPCIGTFSCKDIRMRKSSCRLCPRFWRSSGATSPVSWSHRCKKNARRCRLWLRFRHCTETFSFRCFRCRLLQVKLIDWRFAAAQRGRKKEEREREGDAVRTMLFSVFGQCLKDFAFSVFFSKEQAKLVSSHHKFQSADSLSLVFRLVLLWCSET